MLRSLTTAISGLQNFQGRMDVIGNNIANVNTTAFKSARVDFSDSFSQTLRRPGSGEGKSAALQVGSGVGTDAIRDVYSQGAMSRTGVLTDLAIGGEGYFVVRDTVTDSEFISRNGAFRIDETGFLVTNSGHRLQGFNTTALNAIGDLQIDLTGMPGTSDPNATMVSWSVSNDGKIGINLSDGTSFVRGQVLLQNVRNPAALVKQGNSLYSGLESAGPLGGATPTAAPPGTSGLGKIESGTLELSNVDLANEFSSMITAQRAFQATARVISTSDEMLQELVNLKR
jgi:flagellar hook protein FlgE